MDVKPYHLMCAVSQVKTIENLVEVLQALN